MSIPKLIQDLNIIQKLSDLPNSSDGLSADELKAKFDEGANLIQTWLNETLIPALIAEKIPFAPTAEINEDNIQSAIQSVQAQVRDASTGKIINGSVTKEKLSEDVQKRAYGGRVWVSLDDPAAEQNTASGFPVGQLWLRPGVTVTNKAGSWVVSGGTAEEADNTVTVQGDGTQTTVITTNNIADAGEQGDRVYVLFKVQEKDDDMSDLTVTVGAGEEQQVGTGGVFSGELLADGTLTVKLTAAWPSQSLADGSFQIVNFTVVNVDAILRQTDDLQEEPDWALWLPGLLPFSEYVLPEKMWTQKKDGQWWPMSFDPDQNRSNLFLQYLDGEKVWVDHEKAISNLGGLRIMTGTYEGTGTARTETLPIAPKILVIHPNGGAIGGSTTPYWDNPIVLADGALAASPHKYGEAIKLSGNEVKFYDVDDNDEEFAEAAEYGNRSGETYTWTAIY